jgi:capsular polysaccharide biosynthesis protein
MTNRPVSAVSPAYDKTGIYEVARDVFVDVVAPVRRKVHEHFRGSLPESDGIEKGFDAGPVLAVYSDSAYVDIVAGLTVADGCAVRETAVVPKLIDQYGSVGSEELSKARGVDGDRIIMPVASQRSGNYCRWWLDSVSKLFICAQSSLLRSKLRQAVYTPTASVPKSIFQQQTLDAMGGRLSLHQEPDARLLRCRSVNSPGLTYGGGQRLSAMVADFARFLDFAIPSQERTGSGGDLLYLSRSDSKMRRVLNETDLVPQLEKLGFRILTASSMSIPEQIDAFRRARVVVGVHGAGLTNILFCRPGTKLVEIFPEGGVHGSAFHRISSHLEFPYYYVVSERIETRRSAINRVNADIRVNIADLVGFLRGTVL